MQLVRSRPIIGPVPRDGGWYEDFAQTGGKTSGLSGGIQAEVFPSNTGLRLEPATISSRGVALPTYVTNKFSDLEYEYTVRGYGSPTTSTGANSTFRQISNGNRLYLTKTGGNYLGLVRAKDGVHTTIAQVSNVPFTDSHRIGVRAIGQLIEVFLDSRLVMSVTEPHLSHMSGVIALTAYDPTPNVARAEFGYLVVRPIGFNSYLVRDSFNRANGAIGTADTGQSWVQWNGPLTISSNALTNSTSNGRHDIDSLISDNYEIGAKFRFLNSVATDRRAILQARSLTSGTDNCLEATLHRSAGHIKLGTRTSGAYADLVTPVVYAVADNTDYWLTVRVQGQTIKVFLSTDGETYSEYISTTSALYTSQTGVGIRLNENSPEVNGIQADNFYMRRL